MTQVPPELTAARERFLELVADIRPELHRYCSRLVGSAIDGEDVVQEALAKAYYALSLSPEVPPALRPWLLRIAHNAGIDFLRRYERRFVEPVAELPEPAGSAWAADELEASQVVRLALSSFFALPVLQRSAVILKDVLGSSLEEIAGTLGTSVPAVKAALHRGRQTLAALPRPDLVPWRDRPGTAPQERQQLERYVALFNAGDWPALEVLLAEECRLDLIAKSARRGRRQIAPYFGNYAREQNRLVIGRAEGRLLLGLLRPGSTGAPAYVMSLDWEGEQVGLIRDYRYVPYLMSELVFELEEGS